MKITMKTFARLSQPADVTIHAVDLALYQVILQIDGQERLLATDDGRPYRERNLQRVREMLSTMPVATVTLHHQSAYDEMIGQAPREGSNAMRLPLKPLDPIERTIH
jgi:hypothetical protein